MTQTTLPKPAKSNKQVQEYLSAVNKGMKSRLIFPSGKGWNVRKPSGPSDSYFETKSEALEFARSELSKTDGQLFVFDEEGRLVDYS
jgi:hypothetical protein